MPGQLSTILYVFEYSESTSPNYLIGSATGLTRLNDKDSVQKFKLTIFYPIDDSKSYVPRIMNEQVLSVHNCKFSLGKDNEIDVRNPFYTILLSVLNILL